MKKLNTKILGALCLLPALVVGSAQAALITDASSLTGSSTTIDFSQFAGNEQQGINGLIQLSTLAGEDIQARTSNDPKDLWLTNTSWNLADNGSWDAARDGFLGIKPSSIQNTNPIQIYFNSGYISGFGFFMNYFLDPNTIAGSVSLSAYDTGATLLEEFIINPAGDGISTSGLNNGGAFKGIQRSTADIAYIELTGFNAVFDDLQFTRDVPEPTSIALLLLGLAGVGYSCKKTKNQLAT